MKLIVPQGLKNISIFMSMQNKLEPQFSEHIPSYS